MKEAYTTKAIHKATSAFVVSNAAFTTQSPLARQIPVLRLEEPSVDDAQANYRDLLVKSRQGANITEEELLAMDSLIYTLTGNGQSVHAAVVNNPDVITVSEKTLCRCIGGRPSDLAILYGVQPSLSISSMRLRSACVRRGLFFPL